jgi:hypothetical protein
VLCSESTEDLTGTGVLLMGDGLGEEISEISRNIWGFCKGLTLEGDGLVRRGSGILAREGL